MLVFDNRQKGASIQTAWDRAFAELKQEIELRHYSKNTFQIETQFFAKRLNSIPSRTDLSDRLIFNESVLIALP
jgi:hypothetical protein